MYTHLIRKIKIKKVIIMILCILCIFSITNAHAFAVTCEIRATASSFSSNWEKTKYYDPLLPLKLKYGYNTFLINEDYAKATSGAVTKDYIHQAIIINGNGTHYGPKVSYEFVSSVDVRHKGTSVTYINRAQK